MARHILTLEEQIKGIRAAIASPRTPPPLKKAFRERMAILEHKIDRQQKRRKRCGCGRAGLLDWLGL
jgi:hypothetical protein